MKPTQNRSCFETPRAARSADPSPLAKSENGRPVRSVFACVLVVAVAVAGSARTAAAEGNVALERFEVQLWPDYDRPETLVMYRARLAADVKLPTEVSFRIPASVGEPHAVAYRAEGDRLLLADHTREVDGQWATIRINTQSRDVQLEYYAPILTLEGKRMFSYTWPGDMKVASFVYGAQQPAAATSFEVSPPATDQVERNDGLIVHTADLGAVAEGKSIEVRISYVSDGTLSAKRAAAKPDKPAAAPRRAAQPEAAPSSTSSSSESGSHAGDDWFIWLVLGLTIAAGAVWVAFAGRR